MTLDQIQETYSHVSSLELLHNTIDLYYKYCNGYIFLSNRREFMEIVKTYSTADQYMSYFTLIKKCPRLFVSGLNNS